jgi:hypothetical protein
MTIHNPFSYNFSYQGDIIYLEITNNAGSVATFFDELTSSTQVTLIPDPEFEQDLINQNIDSDGIINGQVFTSDINNLNSLQIFNSISDLTGLEDFAQLQDLILYNFYPSSSNLTLDLTSNTLLETLVLPGGGDAIYHDIEKIDLSDNPNINLIEAPEVWPLRQIDLKSGSTDVSNLNIDITIIPFNLQGGQMEQFNNDLFCIKVTDEDAATAGTGVYSTWTITADDNPYYFSETCALSTDRFKDVEVNIYPNPTAKSLNIEAINFEPKKIKIYSPQGQLLKNIENFNARSIDVSDLSKGLYIIEIESDFGALKKRFLKR